MTILEIESQELDSCPYCDSTNIEGESPDPDTGGRTVSCLNCGRYWDEGFVFTTVYIPEEHVREYLEHKFIKENCTCISKPELVCVVHGMYSIKGDNK